MSTGHTPLLLYCVLTLWLVQVVNSRNNLQLRRVCYFTNWSCDLLVKEAYFCLHDLDASLCSHIIYAFAGIDLMSLNLSPTRVDDETSGDAKGRYVVFNDMKRNNTGLKTLLSVGGSYQAEKFKNITSTVYACNRFAYNAARYLRKWGFDGLDLDWEYPGELEKDALTLLVQELRSAFREEAMLTGRQELLLSLAAPVGEERVHLGYQVDLISKDVDMINLMAYDFYYGAWDMTAFNSPLFPRNHNSFSKEYSVEWIIHLWIRLGAPSHKINLGIAGYGQSFTLKMNKQENLKNDSMGVVSKTDNDFLRVSGNFSDFSRSNTTVDDLLTIAKNKTPISTSEYRQHSSAIHLSELENDRRCVPHSTNCIKELQLLPKSSGTNNSRNDTVSIRWYDKHTLVEKGMTKPGHLDTANIYYNDRSTYSDTTINGQINNKDSHSDTSVYGVGSKATGPGRPGRLRHLKGQLSYPEICEMRQTGAQIYWDQEQRVPYIIQGDQWVGFDNARSVAEKVRWAYDQHLGGVMFWSLDLDDFTGDYCKEGNYPLLSSMSDSAISIFSQENNDTPKHTTHSTRVTQPSEGTNILLTSVQGSRISHVTENSDKNILQVLRTSSTLSYGKATMDPLIIMTTRQLERKISKDVLISKMKAYDNTTGLPTVTAASNTSRLPDMVAASNISRLPAVTAAINRSNLPTVTAAINRSNLPAVTAAINRSNLPAVTAAINRLNLPAVTAAINRLNLPTGTAAINRSNLPAVTAAINRLNLPTVTAAINRLNLPTVTAAINRSNLPAVTAAINRSNLPTVTAAINRSNLPTVTAAINRSNLPTVTATINRSNLPAVTVAINRSNLPTVTASINRSNLPAVSATSNTSGLPAVTATSNTSDYIVQSGVISPAQYNRKPSNNSITEEAENQSHDTKNTGDSFTPTNLPPSRRQIESKLNNFYYDYIAFNTNFKLSALTTQHLSTATTTTSTASSTIVRETKINKTKKDKKYRKLYRQRLYSNTSEMIVASITIVIYSLCSSYQLIYIAYK